MKLLSITNEEQFDLLAILYEREALLNWRLATFLNSKHSALVNASNETTMQLRRLHHMLDVVKTHVPVDCET